jgi:hypothetical protein
MTMHPLARCLEIRGIPLARRLGHLILTIPQRKIWAVCAATDRTV